MLIESLSPYAAIRAGARSSPHLPLVSPKTTEDPIVRRANYSLHKVTIEDCSYRGLTLPCSSMLDPRDAGYRPGIASNIYAYQFDTGDGDIIAVPRPRLKTNARGLVGSSDSPAVVWADKEVIYAWNGIWIPPFVFECPEKITFHTIFTSTNAEVRRCMMEHIPGGCLKFITSAADKGTIKIVDKDFDRMGPRILLRISETEVYVLVTTLDTGGNEKHYLLRVNPSIGTCAEAVASTFPMPDGFRYAPTVES